MAYKSLYFAYASNLLAKRIHVTCPSAVRRRIGKLQNYTLDFNIPSSKMWGGCPATIVPQKNSLVWGVVWEIDKTELEELDKQEGIEQMICSAIQVTVESPDGQQFNCKCYQMCKLPEPNKQGEQLPLERQPSGIYMGIVIQGAKESGLPEDYIEFLKKIPHNGFQVSLTLSGINVNLERAVLNEFNELQKVVSLASGEEK